jgi:hypothetical protein
LVGWGVAVGVAALTGHVSVPDNDDDKTIVRYIFEGVTAEQAFEICSASNLNSALLEFTEQRLQAEADAHREKIKQRGGECGHCNVPFVSTPGKPWTFEGYCSKLCKTRGGYFNPEQAGERKPPTASPPAKQSNSKFTSVRCECGHTFEVASMFIGAKRACPSCGQKVVVEAS